LPARVLVCHAGWNPSARSRSPPCRRRPLGPSAGQLTSQIEGRLVVQPQRRHSDRRARPAPPGQQRRAQPGSTLGGPPDLTAPAQQQRRLSGASPESDHHRPGPWPRGPRGRATSRIPHAPAPGLGRHPQAAACAIKMREITANFAARTCTASSVTAHTTASMRIPGSYGCMSLQLLS